MEVGKEKTEKTEEPNIFLQPEVKEILGKQAKQEQQDAAEAREFNIDEAVINAEATREKTLKLSTGLTKIKYKPLNAIDILNLNKIAGDEKSSPFMQGINVLALMMQKVDPSVTADKLLRMKASDSNIILKAVSDDLGFLTIKESLAGSAKT